MKKLSKLVALMVILGSISGCGKEQTKMEADTNQIVETEETTLEMQDEDENDTKAISNEEETELPDDTMTLDEKEQTESAEVIWKADNYSSEICDVKEQGEQYEITAKLQLNDPLYVTAEEYEAYEVGKTYTFDKSVMEMFCVEKSETVCYFTESEDISLEDSLAWGDLLTYRIEKTNSEENSFPVYQHYGNITGDEWVLTKTNETVQDIFVANKDCIVEYYSETYQLSQTTLEEFVNSQLQGSCPYENLWRNLYYPEVEVNDKGEIVRITESLMAG